MLALPQNLGFGGGSNAGFRAAKNDIVVLLNSDMRVAPDFLAPLLEGFSDPEVFAVSCQIFFSDPSQAPRRDRPDARLVAGRRPARAPSHRRRRSTISIPASTAAAASCAFDRAKFLELGGFDRLLAPFYLEDTDLGYMAWKRGWKVLYQPRSVVYHEHRGTIGKKFHAGSDPGRTEEELHSLLLEEHSRSGGGWRRTSSSPGRAPCWPCSSATCPLRPNLGALWRAFRQLPQALRSRRRALALAAISDTEAFRRPLGGYFRDRFAPLEPRPGPAARAVRLALSDLSAGPRRRRLHVPDAARDGEAGRGPRRRIAGLARRRRRTTRNCATFCASAEWLVRPSGRLQGHGLARAARGPRVRQRRSRVADPPPALSAAASTCCSSSTHRWRSIAASFGGSPRRCSSTTSTSSRSAAASAT